MIARALYSKTRINVAICNIAYASIVFSLLLSLDIYLISLVIHFSKINNIGPVILLSILAFVFLFLCSLLIAAIAANIGIIIKNKAIIKYYNNINLSNIKRIRINYDSKLWLTAAKNSFHPQSFIVDAEEYKTGIIFTNSSSYYGFPKFKMPEALKAKNYINYFAEIGYDENKKEYVVIKFCKNLTD